MLCKRVCCSLLMGCERVDLLYPWWHVIPSPNSRHMPTSVCLVALFSLIFPLPPFWWVMSCRERDEIEDTRPIGMVVVMVEKRRYMRTLWDKRDGRGKEMMKLPQASVSLFSFSPFLVCHSFHSCLSRYVIVSILYTVFSCFLAYPFWLYLLRLALSEDQSCRETNYCYCRRSQDTTSDEPPNTTDT